MKKFLFFTFGISILLTSCDKVKNAYPKTTTNSTLDWSLYPDGDSAYYVSQGLWPTFSTNPNTLRNVLIEDFTGHQCINCPPSTLNMEQLIATNPNRIFGLAIHAGPTGMTGFQQTNSTFPNVLYCNASLEIGSHFGEEIPGSTFLGNPAFCVNRILGGNQFTSNAGSAISNKTNNALSSVLKVNLQAQLNYFTSTRGLFLHTEIDKIDAALTNEIAIVVCLVEDSLVGPQLVPSSSWDQDGVQDGVYTQYVHRDILRGMIDNRTFGKVLSPDDLGSNNKYYVDYSYKLPNEYDPNNMKVYIYVYDKITQEIYQIIEKHLI
jgi:hypothetical protein